MITFTIPAVKPVDTGYFLTKEFITIHGNKVLYHNKERSIGYVCSCLRVYRRSLKRAEVKDDSVVRVIRILRKLKQLDKGHQLR